MSECPNCHDDGTFGQDNQLTSVFYCRNDNCRVGTFDHIPVAAAEKINDD